MQKNQLEPTKLRLSEKQRGQNRQYAMFPSKAKSRLSGDTYENLLAGTVELALLITIAILNYKRDKLYKCDSRF